MPLWSFILMVSGGLIGIGVIFDFIAKKKNLHLDPENGLKHTSESERIYKEQHLKQTIDQINNNL